MKKKTCSRSVAMVKALKKTETQWLIVIYRAMKYIHLISDRSSLELFCFKKLNCDLSLIVSYKPEKDNEILVLTE